MLAIPLLIWILCLSILILYIRKNPFTNLSVGLAYLCALTFGHILGAIIYLDPTYNPGIDIYLKSKNTVRLQTVVGFQIATQFVIAYVASYIAFSYFLFRKKTRKKLASKFKFETSLYDFKSQLKKTFSRVFRKIFAISFIFYIIYFALNTVNIPSISQIFAQGPIMLVSSMMIAEFLFGLGYELWIYAGILSLLILLIQGFLSYSIAFLVMILGLLLGYKKIKKIYLLYSSAILFLGLLCLKAWLASRKVLRVILFEGKSLNIEIIKDFTISFFENLILNSNFNYHTLSVAIDTRLNLNNILGRTVINWDPSFSINSISQLYIGFIPRAIWPSKPTLSSNTEWVIQLTKMQVADGVSVGLGHVAELYGNFGYSGIIFGAVVIALVFSFIDLNLNTALFKYKVIKAWGILLVGLSLVQPGGIFVKAVNAAMITAVTYFIIKYALKASNYSRKKSISRVI